MARLDFEANRVSVPTSFSITLTHPNQLLHYTTTKLPTIATSGGEVAMQSLLSTSVAPLSGLSGGGGLPSLTAEPGT